MTTTFDAKSTARWVGELEASVRAGRKPDLFALATCRGRVRRLEKSIDRDDLLARLAAVEAGRIRPVDGQNLGEDESTERKAKPGRKTAKGKAGTAGSKPGKAPAEAKKAPETRARATEPTEAVQPLAIEPPPSPLRPLGIYNANPEDVRRWNAHEARVEGPSITGSLDAPSSLGTPDAIATVVGPKGEHDRISAGSPLGYREWDTLRARMADFMDPVPAGRGGDPLDEDDARAMIGYLEKAAGWVRSWIKNRHPVDTRDELVAFPSEKDGRTYTAFAESDHYVADPEGVNVRNDDTADSLLPLSSELAEKRIAEERRARVHAPWAIALAFEGPA